jgi:hypothetical protein
MDASGAEQRSCPEEEASVSMASRQHLPRGRRRRIAALAGVAAMVMLGGLSLADPAAAVGSYTTSTVSPPSSDAPPAEPQRPPADPCTHEGSSTYRATGYYYAY